MTPSVCTPVSAPLMPSVMRFSVLGAASAQRGSVSQGGERFRIGLSRPERAGRIAARAVGR